MIGVFFFKFENYESLHQHATSNDRNCRQLWQKLPVFSRNDFHNLKHFALMTFELFQETRRVFQVCEDISSFWESLSRLLENRVALEESSW